MKIFEFCFLFAEGWKRYQLVEAKTEADAIEIVKKIYKENSNILDWDFYDKCFFPDL